MQDIAFQKRLASIILDNKYDRFVKNRKNGKLDTNSLYKIGHSNKLFKRKEARKNKHYAVSLVVDCSGSMCGGKIKTASESARRLSWHLDKMQIPHNIIAFHAGAIEMKTFKQPYQKDIATRLYEEVAEDRHVYIYATDGWGNTSVNFEDNPEYFVEDVNNPGKRLWKLLAEVDYKEYRRIKDEYYKDKGVDVYGLEGPGYNSDAEALKIARELLLKQVGSKIMIHLSDGQPAPLFADMESPIYAGTSQRGYDLKYEVDITIQSGIDLYSIGIESKSVEHYYPAKRTRVINDTKELYPTIIELLKRNIKRG